jgi:2,3,4,5-tetrahydropyridine-2-carboxylate N-succinyltransferase
VDQLEQTITALWEGRDDLFAVLPEDEARAAVHQAIELLDTGKARVAELQGDTVVVNQWLKYAVLLLFRLSKMDTIELGPFEYADKIPLKHDFQAQGVRVVPGASARWGAYLAPGAVMMPSYVNIGAHVGADTMVDTWATVGSCAQIGERVHLSAAAQIGGVLEPIGATPVVIEDDVVVGGNCGVYEGTLVRARAVLGAGTILTRSTPLYDLVRGEVYRATADRPLEVPENAVVVPGSRAVKKGKGKSDEWNLSLYTPVIVKYRDEKTERGIELEDWLR